MSDQLHNSIIPLLRIPTSSSFSAVHSKKIILPCDLNKIKFRSSLLFRNKKMPGIPGRKNFKHGCFKMELIKLQEELRKRCILPVKWNYRYNRTLEPQIKFLYEITSFEKVLRELQKLDSATQQYGMNRWYNFWSHQGIQQIFTDDERCKPVLNKFGDVDKIGLETILFRVKSLVYPYQFARTLRYAILHQEELLYWLYRRTKFKTRADDLDNLFVIFYQRDGEHWKLKAELCWVESLIMNYLDRFEVRNLVRLHLSDNKSRYGDIIWCVKPD
jgi:hypothetical protein